MSLADVRRERLSRARLYFVTDAAGAERALPAAFEGGVDIVQLREKAAPDGAVVEAGLRLRALCDEHDGLLIVNDRADLALACGADGVHVGQDDEGLDRVREKVGPELIVGISTHSPEQVDAALSSTADYLGVGPVYATPTKEGRAPVGLELVRYAAEHAGAKPWFAIGGIDPGNADAVAAAGATRIAVVRAIRNAEDPRAAASVLRGVEAHA
ncbi:MAG TPA: thiamine phosphate synthase [Thermoleophilaceae bacterium]|nr:thiamine phosphate synthase [Thermoleophilaceae bacterium]